MKNRNWKAYHAFEGRQKSRLLKKLSTNDSFKILTDLYQFAYRFNNRPKFNKLDIAKIKLLARVHAVFGKA